MKKLINSIKKFDRWFNRNFEWFFCPPAKQGKVKYKN